MMNLKKIIALLLVLVLGLLLTACSDEPKYETIEADDTTEKTEPKATNSEEPTTEPTSTPTTEPTTEPTAEPTTETSPGTTEETPDITSQLEYSTDAIVDSELIEEFSTTSALYYSPDYTKSIYLKVGQNRLDVAENMASEPVVSPDKTMFAYLYPYDFETKSELYIYNLEFYGIERSVNLFENNDVFKSVTWIDDYRLFVVVGFTYGTISFGGTLYMFDISDNSLSLVLEPDGNNQILGARFENNVAVIEHLRWLDDSLNEYETFEVSYSLTELLDGAVPSVIGYIVN